MSTYIVILLLLFAAALFQIYGDRYRVHGGIAAAIILVLFAGLRYQTGNDWLWYDKYFAAVKPVWHSIDNLMVTSRACFSFELFYLWLNVAFRTFTENSACLHFAVAAFSILGMHFVLRRITSNEAVVWVVYFGLIFLAAQMAMVRQAIACTFVFLGLFLAVRERPWSGTAVAAIGVGFQVSVLPYIVLIWLRKWRPNPIAVAGVILVGLGVAIAGFDTTKLMFWLVSHVAPAGIAEKLSFYAASATSPISAPTYGLIAVHCAALAAFYYLPNDAERRNPVVILGIWLTFGLVAGHLFAFGSPIIWNRFMLIAVPWEVATLFSLSAVNSLPRHAQAALVSALLVISGGSLAYTLSKPAMASFVPYQSYADVWLGRELAGIERYYESLPDKNQAQRELEKLAAEKLAQEKAAAERLAREKAAKKLAADQGTDATPSSSDTAAEVRPEQPAAEQVRQTSTDAPTDVPQAPPAGGLEADIVPLDACS